LPASIRNSRHEGWGKRISMRRFISFGLAALTLSASGTAHAAVLDGVRGRVLINRGGGYRLAKGPMELKPGDSVIVNSGSSAVVSYDDGCSVAVEAGAVVAIAAGPSPCATQANLGPASAPAAGGLDGTTLGVGALVVGGVIGAASLISGGGTRDKPASP
jgi:hypothetical protein